MLGYNKAPALRDLHFVGRYRPYVCVRSMLRKIKLGKEENASLDGMSGCTSDTLISEQKPA